MAAVCENLGRFSPKHLSYGPYRASHVQCRSSAQPGFAGLGSVQESARRRMPYMKHDIGKRQLTPSHIRTRLAECHRSVNTEGSIMVSPYLGGMKVVSPTHNGKNHAKPTTAKMGLRSGSKAQDTVGRKKQKHIDPNLGLQLKTDKESFSSGSENPQEKGSSVLDNIKGEGPENSSECGGSESGYSGSTPKASQKRKLLYLRESGEHYRRLKPEATNELYDLNRRDSDSLMSSPKFDHSKHMEDTRFPGPTTDANLFPRSHSQTDSKNPVMAQARLTPYKDIYTRIDSIEGSRQKPRRQRPFSCISRPTNTAIKSQLPSDSNINSRTTIQKSPRKTRPKSCVPLNKTPSQTFTNPNRNCSVALTNPAKPAKEMSGARCVPSPPEVVKKPSHAQDVLHHVRLASARRRRQRLQQMGEGGGAPFKSTVTRTGGILAARSAHISEKERTEKEEAARERTKQVLRRFRRGVTLCQMVLVAARTMREVSGSKTLRTAVELQYQALHGNKAAQLAFNPAIYSKNRVHTKLPIWARRILEKPTEARTGSDCQRIHTLIRGMRSFERFTEKIQLAMCKAFVYVNVDSQRVVLRKGHVGQNFYFIYSGSVFVNVEEKGPDGKVFVKTEVVLSKGDSFGEMALLKDIRRTATITCREDCELLAVDKEVFALVCPRIFEEELEEKVQFLSHLPLFSAKHWCVDSLRELCSEAQIQEFKTNRVVVADSRADDWTYICMQGQCRIIKSLSVLEEAVCRESQLISDDQEELLTAQFLQSLNADTDLADASKEKADEELTPQEKCRRHKKQLLETMRPEHVHRVRTDSHEAEMEKQQKAMFEKDEDHVEELRQRSQQAAITFNMFVTSRQHKDMDYVYLDIGMLQPQQIFDLSEMLKPSEADKGNSLVLVSSGAKLLRFKKQSFLKALNEDRKEHAIQIAKHSMYPSDSVLLNSVKTRAEWDEYKQVTIRQALGPYLNQVRRRPLLRYEEQVNSMKRASGRDLGIRLLSTLKKEITDIDNKHEVHAKFPRDFDQVDRVRAVNCESIENEDIVVAKGTRLVSSSRKHKDNLIITPLTPKSRSHLDNG